MKTALVWLLISVSGYNANNVNVVAQFPDLKNCEYVRKNLPREPSNVRCVQATIVLEK